MYLGRTLNQCIRATELLGVPVPTESLRREYTSRIPHTPPLSVPSTHPPMCADHTSAPSIPALLSAPATTRNSTPHVHIQPRPANGLTRPPPISPIEPPAKKRRGRPPRSENLRHRPNPSPRPLQPLAPQPPAEPSQGLVPMLAGKGTPCFTPVVKARAQKRGRDSSNETVHTPSLPMLSPDRVDDVKEVKAEGTGATPPEEEISPQARTESDGDAENGRDA